MEKDSKLKLRRRIRSELGHYRGILLQMADTNQTIRAGNWLKVDHRVRRGLARFFADSVCVDSQGVERPVYPLSSLMQCQRRIARLQRILRRLEVAPVGLEGARPRSADLAVQDG